MSVGLDSSIHLCRSIGGRRGMASALHFKKLMNPARLSLIIAHLSLAIIMALPKLAVALPNCPQLGTSSTASQSSPEHIIETPYGPVQLTSDSAIRLKTDMDQIAMALRATGDERKEALDRYFKQTPPSRFDIALTAMNYVAAMGIAVKIALGFHDDPTQLATAAILLPPTLLFTDFLSGLFHKFFDSIASETNPVWGRAAKDFREHHTFPNNFKDAKYLGIVAPYGKLIGPLLFATGVGVEMGMRPDIATSILTMLLLFYNGNEIHRQAHLANPAKWIKKLQDWRLLLNRKDHLRHHKLPIDSDFGIINGYSNRINNFLSLEAKIDMLLWKALRKLPHNWIQSPRSIPDSVVDDLRADLSSLPEELLVTARDARNSDERIQALIQMWVERYRQLQQRPVDERAEQQ